MRGAYVYCAAIDEKVFYFALSYLTTTHNYYVLIVKIEKYRIIGHIYNFDTINPINGAKPLRSSHTYLFAISLINCSISSAPLEDKSETNLLILSYVDWSR